MANSKSHKNAATLMCLFLLFATSGCRSLIGTVSAPANPLHPSPLPDSQCQAVIRILDKTDELDKMIRSGKAGQPYSDLSRQVELEYMRCQQTLPKYRSNLARDSFGEIIDYYSNARSILEGRVQNPRDTPVELVAEAYVRKTLLRSLLSGKATQKEWQALINVSATGNSYK